MEIDLHFLQMRSKPMQLVLVAHVFFLFYLLIFLLNHFFFDYNFIVYKII